jgi:hypothetical protein
MDKWILQIAPRLVEADVWRIRPESEPEPLAGQSHQELPIQSRGMNGELGNPDDFWMSLELTEVAKPVFPAPEAPVRARLARLAALLSNCTSLCDALMTLARISATIKA